MAGGGGAWKVAYADFVTAMMAFFMVMWLVGQSPKVKEAIAQHFSDPYGEFSDADEFSDGMPPIGRGKRGKKHGEEVRSTAPTDDPDDPEAGKPKILVLHDSERSTVGAMLPFATDSADLTDEAQKRMRSVLPQLAGMPHKIEVRGHCSGRPPADPSPYTDAWELCYARAFAAMQFLQDQGIPPERIRLSQAGPHEPFTLAEDAQKQLRNERVEIYLLNEFVQDLQGAKHERPRAAHSATPSSGVDSADAPSHDGHAEDAKKVDPKESHAAGEDHGDSHH